VTRRFFFNLQEFVRHFPQTLGITLSFLFAFGVIRHRKVFLARGGLELLVVCGFYGVVYSFFYTSRRFWLPLLPMALPWCAAGTECAVGFVRERWKIPTAGILTLLTILIIPEGIRRMILRDGWRGSPERTLAARLVETYGPRHIFVSTKGRVAWYAEGTNLSLPHAPLDGVVAYMRHRGARFLILDRLRAERRQAEFWAELKVDPRFVQADREEREERDLWVFELRPRN
jgi:hypothetical protein